MVSIQDDPNIKEFNPSSTQQLQQLFFAPFERKQIEKKKYNFNEDDEELISNLENPEYDDPTPAIKPNKIHDSLTFPLERTFKVPNTLGTILPNRKIPNKFTQMTIKGLGMPIIDVTASGLPSVDIAVLKKMVGDSEKKQEGHLFKFFYEKAQINKGEDARKAVGSLIEHRTIETLIQTFIIPLQVSF